MKRQHAAREECHHSDALNPPGHPQPSLHLQPAYAALPRLLNAPQCRQRARK